MIRAVVLFTNYGPYHIARARALAQVKDIETHFLELARVEKKYPWQIEGEERTLPVTTLVQGAYEEVSGQRITVQLLRVLNALDPDVVVICGYRELPMSAAAFWARFKRRKCILMFETTEFDRPRTRWLETLKRGFLHHFVHGAFCGGKSHRRYLVALGMAENRIWEKYDVVDNDYFSSATAKILASAAEAREALALPSNYFLYVGRFAPEKNLFRLLQAYRAYRDANPDGWRLVLVGDGPQRQQLADVASGLVLTDLVWPGFKQIGELPPYYALASAFILPSAVEPWGLVTNEAMACGLPVLVSNRCGCAADLLVQGHNGYSFDPYDVNQITLSMLKVSSLDEGTRRRMGNSSRLVISAYSTRDWAESLAGCIRNVMVEPNSAPLL